MTSPVQLTGRNRRNVMTGAPDVRYSGGFFIGKPAQDSTKFPKNAAEEASTVVERLGLESGGYITSDGVSESEDRSTEKILDWNLDPGCPVVSKVPVDRPELFVRVDMGAPDRISLIQYRTQIIIQVYGDDLEQVLTTIFGLQPQLETMDMKDPLVSGWEESSGAVEFPDPDIPQHRWQMVGELYSTFD